jgi:hypothetical protein
MFQNCDRRRTRVSVDPLLVHSPGYESPLTANGSLSLAAKLSVPFAKPIERHHCTVSSFVAAALSRPELSSENGRAISKPMPQINGRAYKSFECRRHGQPRPVHHYAVDPSHGTWWSRLLCHIPPVNLGAGLGGCGQAAASSPEPLFSIRSEANFRISESDSGGKPG